MKNKEIEREKEKREENANKKCMKGRKMNEQNESNAEENGGKGWKEGRKKRRIEANIVAIKLCMTSGREAKRAIM